MLTFVCDDSVYTSRGVWHPVCNVCWWITSPDCYSFHLTTIARILLAVIWLHSTLYYVDLVCDRSCIISYMKFAIRFDGCDVFGHTYDAICLYTLHSFAYCQSLANYWVMFCYHTTTMWSFCFVYYYYYYILYLLIITIIYSLAKCQFTPEPSFSCPSDLSVEPFL